MDAKIFVIEMPSLFDVMENLNNVVDEFLEEVKTCCNNKQGNEFFSAKNCHHTEPSAWKPSTPTNDSCRVPEWRVGGEPADENKRFGYGLEVDEPMYQEFDNDEDFLEARQAFDDFVDAGEHCRELGLEKTNDAPITKCNAIRKPIGCPPPMNKELLGESQFPWWEIDMDWDY